MQAANFELEMGRVMARLPVGTPLLLHACCAPCLSAVLERLGSYFDVTVFFYNPNIAPGAEYERRLETVRLLLDSMPLERPAKLLEGEYDTEAFTAAARDMEEEPEGGIRCGACFGLRLGQTARMAKRLGIGWYTFTLSISPHKNAALLNKLGGDAAAQHGVLWLPSDFKKRDGYKRSIELSRQYGLYRQDYCGCAYSLRDREARP